jgi:hypothetical protein
MAFFREGPPDTDVRCSSCNSRNSRLAAWFEHSGDLSTGASIEFHRCRECGAGKIEREAHDYYNAFHDDDPCNDWDWYPMSPADAPWPKTPGTPLVGSSYLHPTQVVIADGAVRLVRACEDRHSGDLAL